MILSEDDLPEPLLIGYEEKTDILSKITYTTAMVDVHKAVADWTSTQGRHAHKIRDIMEQVAVFLANRT